MKSNGSLILLVVAACSLSSAGCAIFRPNPEDLLIEDLTSGRPIYIHRAAHFIEAWDGPALPSPYTDALSAWQEIGAARVVWLCSLHKAQLRWLAREYRDEYLPYWSPTAGVSPSAENRMLKEHRVRQQRGIPGTRPGSGTVRVRVESLIESLVSKNSPPPLGSSPAWSDGLDYKELNRVRRAKEDLQHIGLEAFPVLLERLEDQRYSFSYYYGAWINLSVRDMCFWIIEAQVIPDSFGYEYKTRKGATGKLHGKPEYFGTLREPARLREWWRVRRSRTLTELRIEALEWRIREERKIGFTSKDQEQHYLAVLLIRLQELRALEKQNN